MTQQHPVRVDKHHGADARFEPVKHSQRFGRLADMLGLRTKKVLDIGCGYGEHLVHFGRGSVGITTTEAEVAYGASRGLNIVRGNAEDIDSLGLANDFEVIWANNLIEHLLSPHAFLMKLRAVAPHATLVMSVDVIPGIPALMRLKKFRGALAVAHVSFFTLRTFRMTVERTGWKVQTLRPFVFKNPLLDRLFSFITPNAYLIADNDENFAYPEKKLKEWKGEPLYASLLKSTKQD